MVVPIRYREAPEQQVQIDWVDFATGVGYKTFYMAGTADSGGTRTILTTDSSLICDGSEFRIGGNGTDVDFDVEFRKPATIAAENAFISYTSTLSGSNSSAFTCAWIIYHVDKSGVETSIGSITDSTISDGDPTVKRRMTCHTALTKKTFGVGEKLRLNCIVSSNISESGGHFYIDPKGTISVIGQDGRTIPSTATITVPFVID